MKLEIITLTVEPFLKVSATKRRYSDILDARIWITKSGFLIRNSESSLAVNDHRAA